MDETTRFDEEKARNIALLGASAETARAGMDFIIASSPFKYTYNFTWLGIPIIQFPQDMLAMQEVIWRVRPDLIIETGVAHGGSILFYASLLRLLGNNGRVLGIDIDIREHNRARMEAHPMFSQVDLIQGSSIDPATLEQVKACARGRERVLVILDSNHTHEHVLRELELYSPLVTKGSYLVVFDTAIEDMPPHFFENRPWGRGDNPRTALREFLSKNDRFETDLEMKHKLVISVGADGYLKCVKD